MNEDKKIGLVFCIAFLSGVILSAYLASKISNLERNAIKIGCAVYDENNNFKWKELK